MKLLVVEDDLETRRLDCRMLAKKIPDAQIYEADNGANALELCKKEMPDVVITDINMPGMDGIEMAHEIKTLRKDTRFIVVTGYSDKYHIERCTDLGVDECILKPVDFKKLFAAVDRCIHEMRAGSHGG